MIEQVLQTEFNSASFRTHKSALNACAHTHIQQKSQQLIENKYILDVGPMVVSLLLHNFLIPNSDFMG